MSRIIPSKESIQFKLLSVFGVFLAMIFIMTATFIWVETKIDHLNDISNLLTQASLKMNEANNAEKNFVLFETINPNFYEDGQSQYTTIHKMHIEEAQGFLVEISKLKESESIGIRSNLIRTSADLDSMSQTFNKLVSLYLERGLNQWGIVGRMQEHIAALEEPGLGLDPSKVLLLRKYEKDYLLKKSVQSLALIREAIQSLKDEVNKRVRQDDQRRRLLLRLDSYQLQFLKLMRIEEEIGFREDRGMKHVLSSIAQSADEDLLEIERQLHERTLQFRSRIFMLIVFISFVFFLVTIGVGYFIIKRLGMPISQLTTAIGQAIESNFEQEISIPSVTNKDEVGQLARDFSFMYNRVQQYTTDLLQQKEEISMQAENLSAINTEIEEKSEMIVAKNTELEQQNEMILKQRDQIEQSLYNVQMLSTIGKNITNHLHVEDILRAMYAHVNELMNASVCAIGIINKGQTHLSFYGMEDGKPKIVRGRDALDDSASLAVLSFKNDQEICINNYDAHYVRYTEAKSDLIIQIGSQSLIYIPLVVKGNRIGVFTVHSREKNAYSEFQQSVIRNLASYASIAIDNAQVYEQVEQQQYLLTQQAHQLQAANEEISHKNKAITASINYAKRIQQTILPSIETVEEWLPDSFILYKPRDIVSGDFYFCSKVLLSDGTHRIVIAAVDCTGHGVPGAFTSMVGASILDQIVNNELCVNPSEILTKLHKGIQYTFKQHESDNKDGMDMAICVIDMQNGELCFAGAKNSLVYVKKGEPMAVLKGDKYSIAGGYRNEFVSFTTQRVVIDKPTTFYLYTDGYQDQFGGDRHHPRKIMAKGFRNWLEEVAPHPMHAQQEELNRRLVAWMEAGKQSQLDDVLVIGFHLEPARS